MAFKIPDTPEELFKQGMPKMPDLNRWIPLVTVVLLALVAAMTSFYSVETDEVGVIRRFGRFARITQPGLHWKWPLGIERLSRVKVRRVFKEEFGFRTLQAGVNTRYSSKSYNEESLMLTGDLNVLDVRWVVQFMVKDPRALLFNIRNPLETVRDVSEAAMREVIGDSSVSEVLTTRKNEVAFEAKQMMQETLDRYQSGIKVSEVVLKEVFPPKEVAASFNEVNEAEQEREKLIYQALKEYERVIEEAKGKAEQTVRRAEGYALARVEKAKGDAARFLETWKAYKSAKDVTRRRLYLETLEEIMPRAGQIYVFDPEAQGALPLLNLNGGTK